MLKSDTHWYWDSWYVKDGDTYHAYYLQAPRSLKDPDLRHINARVGHSTSKDLKNWTNHGECFSPRENAFDSKAIWTGSVVKTGNTFHLFYTGLEYRDEKYIQRVGHATSQDGHTFVRASDSSVLDANPSRYAKVDGRRDEPFRDPWVFAYKGKWHMYVTASRPNDLTINQGVVAHATSDDLRTWSDQGPIISDVGMGQLEVTQTVEIDGQWFLIFCNHPAEMLVARDGFVMGTYSVPSESPLGPFDFSHLNIISHHYAGRIIFNPEGRPVLMGFLNIDPSGTFIGAIDNPVELELTSELSLRPRSSSK